MEFYSIAEQLRADQTVPGVIGKIESALAQAESVGEIAVQFDEKSQCLIVLAAQPQHQLILTLFGQGRGISDGQP